MGNSNSKPTQKDSQGNYLNPNGGNIYKGDIITGQTQVIADPNYKPYIWNINTPFGNIEVPLDEKVGQFFQGFENFFKNVGRTFEGWFNITTSLIENLPIVITNFQELMLDVMGEIPSLINFFTELTVKIVRELRKLLQNPTLLLLTTSTTLMMLLFVSLTALTIAIKIWKKV